MSSLSPSFIGHIWVTDRSGCPPPPISFFFFWSVIIILTLIWNHFFTFTPVYLEWFWFTKTINSSFIQKPLTRCIISSADVRAACAEPTTGGWERAAVREKYPKHFWRGESPPAAGRADKGEREEGGVRRWWEKQGKQSFMTDWSSSSSWCRVGRSG